MLTRRVHWRMILAALAALLTLSAVVSLARVRDRGAISSSSAGVSPAMRPTSAISVGTPALVLAGKTAQVTTPAATATPLPSLYNTHVEAVVGQPQYINPLLARHDVDHDLVSLIFNGLTRVDEWFQIVPDLAQGWDISADGCIYTFELRRDVLWQDGAPFDAEDVLFTVKAMQEQYYQGPPRLANLWRTVKVDKVHRYGVRFTLPEPFSPFLSYTTIGVLPAHLLADVPAILMPRDPFNLAPVGTGRFQVSESHLDQGYLVLRANPSYFGFSPHLERVEFQFYPDLPSIWDAYDQGGVTGIGGLSSQELDAVRKRPSLALYSAPLSREAFVFLNTRHPQATFLAEREVRQALLLGLDRQTLIDQDLGGQGIVAHSVVLPNTWGYHPDLPHYSYDPEAARKLLEQAGWVTATPSPQDGTVPDDGWVRKQDQLPLAFSLVVDQANRTHVRLGQEIARQWAEIGVQVQVEPALTEERLQLGRYTAALLESELPMDPDPYPIWHSTQIGDSGQNYTGFANRKADEAIEQGRQTADAELRRQLYREFQEVWAEELPALPLYHPVYNYALYRDIEGLHLGLMVWPCDRFRNIEEWSFASQTPR